MGREASDDQLMERYALGDGDAFLQLFRRYEARAFGFFSRRVATAEEASDLYQELFLRLHRSRSTYDPRRPFAPWFFQLARSVLMDHRRREWARAGAELPAEGSGWRPPARDGGGEEAAVASLWAHELLALLTLEQRRVVVGTKLFGFGHAEVARQLGKSTAAVRQIGSRALRKLRAIARAGG